MSFEEWKFMYGIFYNVIATEKLNCGCHHGLCGSHFRLAIIFIVRISWLVTWFWWCGHKNEEGSSSLKFGVLHQNQIYPSSLGFVHIILKWCIFFILILFRYHSALYGRRILRSPSLFYHSFRLKG